MPLTLLQAPPPIQKAIYTFDLSIICSRCQIWQSENIHMFTKNNAKFFLVCGVNKKISIIWVLLLWFSLHLEVFESDCAKISLEYTVGF